MRMVLSLGDRGAYGINVDYARLVNVQGVAAALAELMKIVEKIILYSDVLSMWAVYSTFLP